MRSSQQQPQPAAAAGRTVLLGNVSTSLLRELTFASTRPPARQPQVHTLQLGALPPDSCLTTPACSCRALQPCMLAGKHGKRPY